MRLGRSIIRRATPGLVLALALLVPRQAGAQSCSFSVSNVAFGPVDLTANIPFDTTAGYTASCTGGTPGQTLRLCPNLGAGSGGANGANAPRYIVSGANQVGYNLFTDSGRTSVWGSYTGGGNPPELLLTPDGSGNASDTGTMYGRIYAGQQTKPPGSYTSSFSGSPDASLSWAVDTGQDCTAVGNSNATPFSFDVSASYAATCTVSAGTMNYGSILDLSSITDATASLSTTCSASSPYTIGLNDGLASTGTLQRRMTFGADHLSYGLYKDSSRLTPWGNTSGTNMSGTGTGTSQSYTVYGRIPVQITPPAGTYNDTVIVTVSY
jgi:spore coat protein U-like protein